MIVTILLYWTVYGQTPRDAKDDWEKKKQLNSAVPRFIIMDRTDATGIDLFWEITPASIFHLRDITSYETAYLGRLRK